jgi:hypothetical protein
MFSNVVSRTLAPGLLFVFGFSAPALCQDIRAVRVQFDPGANSAHVENRLTGRETVDYVLAARAGQHMNISMATDNGANYFNLIAPGEENVAFFIGSTASGGNQFEGIAPETGDYRVRAYLMRSAARRNEVASYRLEMIITDVAHRPSSGSAGTAGDTGTAGGEVPAAPEDGGPRHWEVTGVTSALNLREDASTSARTIARYAPGTILANLGCRRAEGRVWCDVQELGGGPRGFVAAEFLKPAVAPDGTVATGPDDSALRAGQGDFDATGQVPCAQVRGQPMGQCDFGVARSGGGYATVVVTKPDGMKRGLYFVRGEFLGADTSQADGYPPVSSEKQLDLHRINVGEERYEIPDAVIFGG